MTLFEMIWFEAVGAKIVVCTNSFDNMAFCDPSQAASRVSPTLDVWFGPALRRGSTLEKRHVVGTKVLWVDYDDPTEPFPLLPPTAKVFSGHGWHCYWLLREPLLDHDIIEKTNKELAVWIGGDASCFNVNRILRVPGTTNTKREPVKTTIKWGDVKFLYTLDMFERAFTLKKGVCDKIVTGSTRGFASRSERDWSVVRSLAAKFSYDEVEWLFKHHQIGDKLANTHDGYLRHTYDNAVKSLAETGGTKDSAEIGVKDTFFSKAPRKLRPFLWSLLQSWRTCTRGVKILSSSQ